MQLRGATRARTRSSATTAQFAKQDHNVWSVDLDHLVCPFLPICDPIVNNQIVKWDPTHLTVKFAQSIAPQLNAYLKQTTS